MTLTLILKLLLLLENLLLGRTQVLDANWGIWVSTVLHGRHHGRIHATGSASSHRAASELMRHATSRSTRLSAIRIHTGTHGMTSDSWMSHGSGMALKVGAHTRGHHSVTSKSAIHR